MAAPPAIVAGVMRAEVAAAQQADGAEKGASRQAQTPTVSLFSLRLQPPQTSPRGITDHT